MKNYLVIGSPINHSLSPLLHNHWIKENNIKAVYSRKELNDNELENLISDVKTGKIDGVNVTVPFKEKIISYIDELSPEADTTKSVNTIFLNNGKINGHNTDIYGFEKALQNTKFNTLNKKIFILGAGGVVPSIIVALNKMKVSEITLSNRTKNKAETLKNLYKHLNIVDWGEIPDFDMIINATSVGLNKQESLNLDFSKMKDKFFYDVIYNPQETNFLKKAKNQGNKISNGEMMFIYQASAAFHLWHKVQPRIDEEVIKLLNR